jgi:enolase 1/2/3
VTVTTRSGSAGTADAPAGRSTGVYEARELRDGGRPYHGRGVSKAVENVNKCIAPALVGKDVVDQSWIDSRLIDLDGTRNKSRLGANAIVAVSLAAAKAAAGCLGLPLFKRIGGRQANVLPVPAFDLIEGGKLAASDLDFQEHQVIPVGAKSFSEAMRIGIEAYHLLGERLAKKWGRHSLNVGVEGGYTPPGMRDPADALEAELRVVEELGYGKRCVLGLDAAATHFYDPRSGSYRFMGKRLEPSQLIDVYRNLVSTYRVRSIEDPLEQNDFQGFAEATKELKIQIIGDDLFVTNPKRLREGIRRGAANALLFKVNQIGTLTEALDAAELAFNSGYGVVVSERSGQTEDTWLANVAVGLGAGQIKTGCPCRGERTSQYNELIRIEEELGKAAVYGGSRLRLAR